MLPRGRDTRAGRAPEVELRKIPPRAPVAREAVQELARLQGPRQCRTEPSTRVQDRR